MSGSPTVLRRAVVALVTDRTIIPPVLRHWPRMTPCRCVRRRRVVLSPPRGPRVLGTFRWRLAIFTRVGRPCGIETVAHEADYEDQYDCQ